MFICILSRTAKIVFQRSSRKPVEPGGQKEEAVFNTGDKVKGEKAEKKWGLQSCCLQREEQTGEVLTVSIKTEAEVGTTSTAG